MLSFFTLFFFIHAFLLIKNQIYDCDFNQQLSMPIGGNGKKTTVFDIDSLEDLQDINIRTDNHCFGCTAGMGSS